MQHGMTRLIAASAALALTAGVAQADTIIFSHTFDEGAGGLNTTAVDGGTVSANWVAAPGVTADGAFTGRGSATLAFTPIQGTQYQLDATIADVTGTGDWVALGFANGQSTGTGTGNRFTTQAGAAPEGRAWMMMRGDNSSNPNRVFTEGSVAATSFDWTGTIANANGGDFDLRILLDTTGGAGTWTATWFAKRPTDGSYTEVKSSFLLPDESIDSVGFAMSGIGTTADLQSLTLTQIPEPSSLALLGLGGLLIARRRRN